MSALPASASLAEAEMPAEKMVICCTAPARPHRRMHRQQLAQLLEAEFGIALGDDLADRHGRNHAALGLHFGVDAELLEHLRLDVDAAGAVGIGDRFGLQQNLAEALHRFYIGLRCTRTYGHGDRRANEIDPAISHHLAVVDEVAQRIADHVQHIDRLQPKQTFQEPGCTSARRNSVASRVVLPQPCFDASIACRSLRRCLTKRRLDGKIDPPS